jgi:transcriptional regulator with XRE-family HTH domain
METQDLLNTPGKRLRALRINAGYSQKELADMLEITQSYLSRIEREKSSIHAIVAEVAPILNTTTDYLLMGGDSPRPPGLPGEELDIDLGDADLRLLLMLLDEVPEEERPALIRFLIYQMHIYSVTFQVRPTGS